MSRLDRRRQRHGRAPAGRDAARRATVPGGSRSPCSPRSPGRPTTGSGCRPGSTTSRFDLSRVDGVDVRLGEPAVALDLAGRKVITATGCLRVRRPGAGHRLVPVRAAGARAASWPAASSTAPSTTSRRCPPTPTAGRTGVVVGGGLLGLEAANALRRLGLSHPRGRAGAPADAAAGRRGRRRHAAPAHRGPRPDHPHRTDAATGRGPGRGGQPGGVRRRRRRSAPTWSSSPPASGPATTWPGRPGSPSAPAAASWSTRPAAPPTRTSTRSASAPRSAAGSTGWWRPATRWPRWWPTGCSAAIGRVPRRRHVHQAQAARRRRGLVRCDRGPAGRDVHRPGHPGLRQAGALRRRPDPARRGPRRRRRGVRHAAGLPRPAAAGAAAGPAGPGRTRASARPAGAPPRSAPATRSPRRRSSRPSPSRAAPTSPAVKACTRAGTTCGSCVPLLKQLLAAVRRRRCPRRCASTSTTAGRSCSTSSGSAASRRSPGSSPSTAGAGAATSASRSSPRSWPARPAATSSTASRPSLQDTNDHFLANLQRNGTYSVVPRIPGGEITPEKLIVIGEVARDFGLYTKITGGQRIDLFGARVEQLPRDLAPAGRRRLRVRPRLRQGAAHGEVVRRHDLVPLRRAGLGRPGDRAGAALPRPAGAAQAQGGGLRLRPRVRRGAQQGLRHHRHRERLEPLRRRQRRLPAPPRRPAASAICPPRS